MRRWLAVLASIGVLVVLAAVAWAALVEPLAHGSTGGAGPGPVPQTAERPTDGGTTYTFEEQPGATFAVRVSLRNDGPLPITLLGNGDPTDERLRHGFWREDFALASEEATTPDVSGPAIDRLELQPGTEAVLWARYRISSACADGVVPRAAGSWISTDVLQVDWQLLGMPRHTHVQLPFHVGTRNDGPGEIPCPAPSQSPSPSASPAVAAGQ